MRLFIDDPSGEDDEPVVDQGDQQAPMESSVRACVICGKPSPDGPECDECDQREFRRWGS